MGSFRVRRDRVLSWSGESGAQALPGGGDGGGPASGGVDALPGAAGDAGRDVQDPVTEGVDLAAGQLGVSVNPISWAQATRSAAASTISNQAALD